MKKRKNSSEQIDIDHFDIAYSWAIKGPILAAFVFFGLIFIACAGDLTGLWEFGTNNDLGVCLFFGGFTFLCGWGVLGTVVWKIRVDGDEIRYTTMLGMRKQYHASDIEKLRLRNSGTEPGYNIEVFSGNRRIMKIDGNVCETVLLPLWCRERNIPVEEVKAKGTDQNFVMQATPFYKGLWLVFVFVGLALFILCVEAEYFLGNDLFAVLTIAALIECIRTWTEKIEVKDQRITRTIVLGRKKTIGFGKIEKVVVKNVDNADVYRIYVDGKIALKVSALYKNAERFDKIAKKRNWIRG